MTSLVKALIAFSKEKLEKEGWKNFSNYLLGIR
jgi:hypothetical protein